MTQSACPSYHNNITIRNCLLAVLMVMLLFTVQAQDKKDKLEQEKKDNLARIKEAETILKNTESKKKATLGQLSNINHQIEIRQQLIGTITREVKLIEEDISETNVVIASLQGDLESLKQEYANMLVHTYKQSQGHNRLSFLFAAEDFNQFLMRLKYLEKYAESRKNQVEQISYVKASLEQQITSLEIKREEQNVLLNSQVIEQKNLITLRQKQNSLIQDLSSQEQKLRKELADRKDAIARLDKLIADLVKEEMERSKTKSAAEDIVKLSADFAQNRRKLSWPVESGFISSNYGKQMHPVLQNVEIDNKGIDIQTEENQSVRAVFDGVVASVAFVPGMNNVVLVKHGDYFTLYARLKNVKVRKGDKVNTNQELGQVFTDADGVSEVQFQVWKNSQTLNPAQWLQKR